ncbi:hypothetical protein [Calothrix sp. PCC 6303]|nr:hypothetical protein [Calothrix sp. PCC 6303]
MTNDKGDRIYNSCLRYAIAQSDCQGYPIAVIDTNSGLQIY